MAFIPKNWEDAPSEASPISAAALEDLEIRLATYADSIAGTDPDAVPASLYSTYGGILKGGSTPGDPQELPLGTAGQVLTVVPLVGAAWATSGKLPVYNVKDYGAEGDGSTLDGAAITGAAVAAAGNGILFFPEGVYMVNGNVDRIELPSNTHMVGAGVGQSVIKAPNGMAPTVLMTSTGHSATPFQNITIENMDFDGNLDNVTVGGLIMEFRGNVSGAVQSSRFRMLNCRLRNSPGFGFAAQMVNDIVLMGNWVDNCYRDGLTVSRGCNRVTISNNQINNVGDDAIAVHGYGPTSSWYCSRAVVSGNVIDGAGIGPTGGHGVVMTGVDAGTISGNVIYNGGHGGIMVSNGGSAYCRNITMSGNSIVLTGSEGYNADGSVFTSASETGHGIRIQVSSTGGYGTDNDGSTPKEAFVGQMVVSGNQITNPRGHGIRLAGSATNEIENINISNNQLIGRLASEGQVFASANGIHAPNGAQRIHVSGNYITRFTGRGISIGEAFSQPADWTINNNLILGNGKGLSVREGIHLGDLASGSVMNNRVGDLASPKLQTHALNWGTSINCFVAHNDFRGNLTGSAAGVKDASNVERMNRRSSDGAMLIGDDGTIGEMATGA